MVVSKFLQIIYFNTFSFTLNDVNSLCLRTTTTIQFDIQTNVKQIDGVLLWWDLDLAGNGQLVISTGSDHGGPRVSICLIITFINTNFSGEITGFRSLIDFHGRFR
jgi:hypothetical protein